MPPCTHGAGQGGPLCATCPGPSPSPAHHRPLGRGCSGCAGSSTGPTRAELVPILWGCWDVTGGHSPSSHCQERHKSPACAAKLSSSSPPEPAKISPKPSKIPPPWPEEMEILGHGHELAVSESLRAGSHHPWGRASLLPGPALTLGDDLPGWGVPMPGWGWWSPQSWGKLEEELPFPLTTAPGSNWHVQKLVPHVARRQGGSLGTP